MLFLITFKAALVGGITIHALGFAVHDDYLMTDIASNILQGHWLGTYDNRRLIKGITFPIYLALNHIGGVPYLTSLVILYGAACALFVRTTGILIQNQWVKGVLFTFLYFLPINGCTETLLRVYRNSLAPILILFLFSCFIMMYLMRRDKKVISWAILSGLSLAAFWNLREDSMWILPFVLIACILTAIMLGIENRKRKVNFFHAHMFFILLPFVILFIINTGIKTVNYIYYGNFIRNEISEGGFTEMMRSIYSVAPDEDIYRVSVPKSTINMLYKTSPSFAKLKKYLDPNYGGFWDNTDGDLDGEIKDGWLFWCLRDCITAAGYNTSIKMDTFCRQVSSEIHSALKNSRIKRRSGLLLPFSLISPWKQQYAWMLPGAIKKAFLIVAGNKACDINNIYSLGSPESILKMETITHNLAIYFSKNITISGWIVSNNDKVHDDVAIYQGKNLLTIMNKSGGQDVYDSYAAHGIYLENAKHCRFNSTLNVTSLEDLWFVILRNGIPVSRVALNKNIYHGIGDDYQWYVDQYLPRMSILEKSVIRRVKLLEFIKKFYIVMGIPLTIIGFICYCILTGTLIFDAFLKKKYILLDPWLILTGLLGSTLVLIFGVSYTDISAFPAINNLYLAAGYPILAAFNMLSIIFLFQWSKNKYFDTVLPTGNGA